MRWNMKFCHVMPLTSTHMMPLALLLLTWDTTALVSASYDLDSTINCTIVFLSHIKNILRDLEILNFISDQWLISATTDVEKDLHRSQKKKIRNLKEVDLTTLKENFQQPKLNQNTNVSEAHDQLNLKLQEILDRWASEKIVKTTEKPTKLWFNHTLSKQQKIFKNRERIWKKYKQQHHWRAYTMERNRYIWLLYYTKNNQLVRMFWTARRTPKNSSP